MDEQSYRSTGRFDLQDKAEIERDYLKQESFTWNLLYSLEIGRKQQPGSEWKSHSYDRNLCILHWLETIAKEEYANKHNEHSVAIDSFRDDTICEIISEVSEYISIFY